MAKYHRMFVKFWQSPKVRHWPDHQKLLGAYLLTCPHRTSEGLFWLPHGYVSQDLGWSIERVSEGYSGLKQADFCAYDDPTETVFLLKALKYEAPAGDKQIQGAINRLADVPPSPLFALLREAAERYAPDFAKALDNAFPPPPSDTPPEGYPYPSDYSSSSSSSSSSSIPPTAGRSATAPEATITAIPTAQTFLAAYVDAYRGRAGCDPMPTIKGQLAKHLGAAFAAGYPAEVIKAAFVEWFEDDKHPSVLPSYIEVKGRGGRPRPRTRTQERQQRKDQTNAAMAAWAAEMEGGGDAEPDRMGSRSRGVPRGLPRPGV